MSEQNRFMELAEKMRSLALDSGDQGYGAIVVKDNEVIGFGPSKVLVKGDPTAHAEMEAIRDAAKKLGSTNLRDCILYSTSRACAMCEAAAYWAGIENMIYGDSLDEAGTPRLRKC